MCEEKCMRGLWAGYPLTVQLSLDQLYMFTFMHPFRKINTKNLLVLLCKYTLLFFQEPNGSHMYFIYFLFL